MLISSALDNRWIQNPQSVDILRSVGEHLLVLAPVTRAAVAEVVVKDALLPVLRRLIDFEFCDTHLRPKKRRISTDKYTDDEVRTILLPLIISFY